MAKTRVSFVNESYAVLDETGKVVDSDFLKEDSLANVANIAADYSDNIQVTRDDKGRVLGMDIEIDNNVLERVLNEIRILKSSRLLGEIGYILGLHSGVYVATDGEKPMVLDNQYRAVVQGTKVWKGVYMYATLAKSVVDDKKNPVRIEDIIYLRQTGVDEHEPTEEMFEELLNDLNRFIGAVPLFISRKGQVRLARRYIGIIVGMMVKWRLKKHINNLVAVATTMALEDSLDGRIYRSLMDAVKLAKKLGDL